MSTKRVSKSKPRIPGLCRECGLDVKRFTTRARTYCSKKCKHDYLMRTSTRYARKAAKRKDKNICQICGLNCQEFWRSLKERVKGLRGAKRVEAAQVFFQERQVPYVEWRHRRSFIDVDHILPVIEGGGECGLDNLRVLCIPCHNKETAALRKRLSQSKKQLTLK